MVLPDSVTSNFHVQVHPIILVEVVTVDLHQQLVRLGRVKEWEVHSLLNPGRSVVALCVLCLTPLQLFANFFPPAMSASWPVLAPCTSCLALALCYSYPLLAPSSCTNSLDLTEFFPNCLPLAPPPHSTKPALCATFQPLDLHTACPPSASCGARPPLAWYSNCSTPMYFPALTLLAT